MDNRRKPRIIGAGLPRTGTSSLGWALEILGYDALLHAHQGVAFTFPDLLHMMLSFSRE
jgi:hypothetical protein